MTPVVDPRPLKAFFQEVKEHLEIELDYHPDNLKYPIQLSNKEGITKLKCIELLNFIKGQVDLRDNEIGKIHTDPKTGKCSFEISAEAAKALAEIYALSLFYDLDDDPTEEKKT